MKRLVVCFDGTWKNASDVDVSNIEKIARTVRTDGGESGVQQVVSYIPGVGANYYLADRLLGGALGFGTLGNLVRGYRFLCLNYAPGDQVFVFGFSRGAATARSLAGMISRVGLLDVPGLMDGRLDEAVRRYTGGYPRRGETRRSAEEFRAAHCHASPEITFLGVFDTVAALGRRARFNDFGLCDVVAVARQALAVDEQRVVFRPLLWDGDDGDARRRPDRVKQVWFQGAHSDVGGGSGPESGLSDTTLLWMLQEARAEGLEVDDALLLRHVFTGARARLHPSLTPFYRLSNAWRRLCRIGRPDPAFARGRRVLAPPGARDVRVASSAVTPGPALPVELVLAMPGPRAEVDVALTCPTRRGLLVS
ncbi:DUF2235 domain-containing protein [Solicola sp. PLA-1-18]|uniref:DUF2235 domain-containing protein n=1 Tax=Solicola sp. PLA-1-18 TaxID=3380532 RepID=UPI003B79D957